MTLPRLGWSRCSTPSAMRATDRWAIEERGIPSLQLMERAGEGLAGLVWEVAPTGPVAIVCGKGNNGGDGLVAARLLRAAGARSASCSSPPPEELQGDAAENLRALPVEAEPFARERLEGVAAIVDAVLGTGLTGAPREPAASVIAAIDAADAPVIAADVPSGVDASTGEVGGAAVHATATATFAAAKPGLWISPGKEHAGRVEVVDIGMPGGRARASPPPGSSAPRSWRSSRAARGRGRSSRPATSSSRAARAGSPAPRPSPPSARCARARATSPCSSRAPSSRSSPSSSRRR